MALLNNFTEAKLLIRSLSWTKLVLFSPTSASRTDWPIFMKFCMCECLWHLMIPRLFGLDQIRAESIAFNKPVVMTTKRGPKSNGSTDFHEISLGHVFATYDNPYCFCYRSDESWAYAIPINRSYGYEPRLKVLICLKIHWNILSVAVDICTKFQNFLNMQSHRRQLKILKSHTIRVF